MLSVWQLWMDPLRMFRGRDKSLPAFGAPVKKFVAPALLAVLMLTGCPTAAAPAPSDTPALTVAEPTEAQQMALMTDPSKVKPELVGPDLITGARLVCRSILAGDGEAVQVVKARDRFSKVAGKAISEADAKRVLAIVKSNGFCKKA